MQTTSRPNTPPTVIDVGWDTSQSAAATPVPCPARAGVQVLARPGPRGLPPHSIVRASLAQLSMPWHRAPRYTPAIRPCTHTPLILHFPQLWSDREPAARGSGKTVVIREGPVGPGPSPERRAQRELMRRARSPGGSPVVGGGM